MTSHVVTRFYRAPEVILKVPYSNKIDMWAAGCIFKEVLELTRPPRLESSKQQVLPAVDPNTVVLFAGEWCSAFSPPRKGESLGRNNNGPELDQLGVILATIGTPTASEFAHVPEAASECVRQRCPAGVWSQLDKKLRSQEITTRLMSLIPWMSTAEVELLSSFLALCPKRRPSASSALKAEYFAPLPAEQRPGPTAVPSTAVLDSTFSFESSSISIKDLRELFADDLHRFAMAEGRTLAEGSLRAIPSQPQQSRLSVALANVLRHNESHMTAAWDRDVQDFETVVANWIDSVVVALKGCQRGLQKQFDSGGHTETAGERLTADGRADEGLDPWSA